MKNKIVLITGATSGIGWATAQTFNKAGARLILCGRRTEKLEALAKEIGGNTQLLTFDVRDKIAVFEAIESLPEDWKRIDVLVTMQEMHTDWIQYKQQTSKIGKQ